jgi:hypothetical protein
LGVPPAGSGHSPKGGAASSTASPAKPSVPNAKHPGKTPAQRRVLDEIGCGNHSPIMAKATRDKLLRERLIVEIEPRHEHCFGGVQIRFRQFDMPIPIHMQWCKAMAAECDAQEKAR